MQVLVLLCHPDRDSYLVSIHTALVERLTQTGHEVRTIDLYAEGFDPILGIEAWRDHRAGREGDPNDLAGHVAALREAEGLILVYPTWWYGLPAMLKGWFDRIWRPGVAFVIEDGAFRTHYLPRLRGIAAVTTYGSPRPFIEGLVGDPARRQVMRGLALQAARGVWRGWAPIYAVDGKSPAQLAADRECAVRKIARLFR